MYILKSDICDCDWWWVIGFWCTCWYRLMYTRDSYLGKRACISVSRWKPVSFSITTCPWCFGWRFRILSVIQRQPLSDLMCFSFSCVRYIYVESLDHDGFESQNLLRLSILLQQGFGFTVHIGGGSWKDWRIGNDLFGTKNLWYQKGLNGVRNNRVKSNCRIVNAVSNIHMYIIYIIHLQRLAFSK